MKHYAYDSPFNMVDKEGNKYLLTVKQDEMPESPREWENVATMICWHNRYDLGDQHNFDYSFEFLLDIAKEIGIYTEDMEEMTNNELLVKIQSSNLIVILPINLYDHSGITISTSNDYPYNDRWDAGCVGFAYIIKEKAFKELREYVVDDNGERIKVEHKHENMPSTWSYKTQPLTNATWKKRAIEVINTEVEIYDQYLRGDVYGYILEKEEVVKETCPHCGEVISSATEMIEEDSCWGFYGDCLEENGILDNVYGLKFID